MLLHKYSYALVYKYVIYNQNRMECICAGVTLGKHYFKSCSKHYFHERVHFQFNRVDFSVK